MSTRRIGIQSDGYLVGNRTKEEAYALMREQGFTCMDNQDLWDTETELFRSDMAEFERRLKEERRRAEAFGLSFNQTHGPWRWPPQDTTEENLRERYAAMKKALYGTAVLGASICVIHCIMPFGENNPEHGEELWDMNRKFYGHLCEEARKVGVVIGFENLPFTSLPLSRTDQTLSFVRMMDTPSMTMCFDTGHCAVYGDSPAEGVRMIGKKWLGCLHVHDNDGHRDLHWPVGEGVIDWADFAKALDDIGYEGVVSLETCVPKSIPIGERETAERKLAEAARRIAGDTDT